MNNELYFKEFYSFEEIGRIFGRTRQNARQIYKKALRKIKYILLKDENLRQELQETIWMLFEERAKKGDLKDCEFIATQNK